MALVILTGASCSGKTTNAERIEQQHTDQARVFRFDSIGVPSPAERIARWGSGVGWQHAMTIDWLLRIAGQRDTLPVLFEGQMRLSFIKEGLATAGIGEARVVLVHCDDATRTHRLRNERKQPELANSEMMNWARFLLDEAEADGRCGDPRRIPSLIRADAMTPQIEPQHALSPDEIDAIEDRLYAHNSHATGRHDGEDLGFVIRDESSAGTCITPEPPPRFRPRT